MRTPMYCLAVAAGLVASAMASASGVLAGHWTFDESTGAVAADSGPNGLDGALMGAAAFAPGGVSGNAISLSRTTNDHVDMGNTVFNGQPFSASAWIQTTSTSDDTFAIGRHYAGTNNGYVLGINRSGGAYGLAGRAWSYVSSSPSGVAISSTTVTDGQWHHLLMTYSASGLLTIFVDGVREATMPPQTFNANTAPFLVGGLVNQALQSQGVFTGLIDDVQLYDGVLNGQQICFIFNNPGAAASLIIDGDLNYDGTVNFADLNLLLSTFNMSGFCLTADINGDGIVDFGDLNIQLSNFNMSE